MPTDMSSALVAHAYRQLPIVLGGSLATVAIASLVLWPQPALPIWLAVQSVCHGAGALVLIGHRRRRPKAQTPAAVWLRRGTTLLVAAGWGLGGLLWPIDENLSAGTLMVFCYAGVLASWAMTEASDPRWFPVVATTAVASEFAAALDGQWGFSALLGVSVIAMSLVTHRNGQTLREALSLRFKNDDILAEARRQRAAALAQASAKARFLAAASHDLRQPTQALSLFVDVLTRDSDPASERRNRAVAALGHSAETLRTMLESLLDISRLDAGVVEVRERSVRVRQLLEHAADALREEAKTRDIKIRVRGRRFIRARADPVLLARVLHNLASNAVRYGRDRVLLGARCHGDHCVLLIGDRGPGIPSDEHERIFEDLVRLNKANASPSAGLGLGLSMVKRICDLSGWTLRLHSREGHGTLFEVKLPLIVDETLSVQPGSLQEWDDGPTVLVVESDALVRGALASWLESTGWQVTTVPDGEQALRAQRELIERGSAPDAVVIENGLPGDTSGAALLGQMSEVHPPPAAAVLITGDVEYTPPAALGQVQVLYKPVSANDLHRALSEQHYPPAADFFDADTEASAEARP